MKRVGLILERGSLSVVANVYPVHQFSQMGFDCGTLNDGASNLALSTLHTLLPPAPRRSTGCMTMLTIWPIGKLKLTGTLVDVPGDGLLSYLNASVEAPHAFRR